MNNDYGTFTVDDIKAAIAEDPCGFYGKYVRVGNEFRFCGCLGQHRNLVKEGETPVSAATIKIRQNKGFVIEGYSMMLKMLGRALDDGEKLSLLFNLPEINSYDW